MAAVVMPLRVMPVAAVKPVPSRVAKSVTSVAEPLAAPREKVTLRPTPRPTPSRATA